MTKKPGLAERLRGRYSPAPANDQRRRLLLSCLEQAFDGVLGEWWIEPADPEGMFARLCGDDSFRVFQQTCETQEPLDVARHAAVGVMTRHISELSRLRRRIFFPNASPSHPMRLHLTEAAQLKLEEEIKARLKELYDGGGYLALSAYLEA